MIAFCIIVVLAAIAIVLLVLAQSGKSHGLSGSIAGGAETFIGKSKGKKFDAVLNKITTVVVIAFVVLLVGYYVIQPDSYNVETPGPSLGNSENYDASAGEEDTTAEDTTAEDTTADTVADDTAADSAADTTADSTTTAAQ